MARRRGEPRGKSPRRRAPFLDFFGGFPNAPNQPNPLALTLPQPLQHPFPQEKLRLPKVLILFPCGSPTSSLFAHHSLSLSLSFSLLFFVLVVAHPPMIPRTFLRRSWTFTPFPSIQRSSITGLFLIPRSFSLEHDFITRPS